MLHGDLNSVQTQKAFIWLHWGSSWASFHHSFIDLPTQV